MKHLLAYIILPLAGNTHFTESVEDTPETRYDKCFHQCPQWRSNIIISRKYGKWYMSRRTQYINRKFDGNVNDLCVNYQPHNWKWNIYLGKSFSDASINNTDNMMGYFENLAFGSTPIKSLFWHTDVAEIFILWFHWENLKELLDHVNSIKLSIHFPLERENNNQLASLNAFGCINNIYGLWVQKYCKPTFTGCVLSFNSHHL